MRRREAEQSQIRDHEEEISWARLDQTPKGGEKLEKVRLETMRRRKAIQGKIRDHDEEIGWTRLD